MGTAPLSTISGPACRLLLEIFPLSALLIYFRPSITRCDATLELRSSLGIVCICGMLSIVHSNKVFSFGGAVRTRILEQPDNAYTFEAIFRPSHPLGSKIFAQKPPMHFHPYQNEHIRVLEGKLVVEVDGHEHVRSASDDDFRVDAWTNHRLYPFCPAISSNTEAEDVRVLIWGQKTTETFHEDILFLENWFKYQDDIVMNKKNVGLLQILSVSYAFARCQPLV